MNNPSFDEKVVDERMIVTVEDQTVDISIPTPTFSQAARIYLKRGKRPGEYRITINDDRTPSDVTIVIENGKVLAS